MEEMVASGRWWCPKYSNPPPVTSPQGARQCPLQARSPLGMGAETQLPSIRVILVTQEILEQPNPCSVPMGRVQLPPWTLQTLHNSRGVLILVY